MVVLRLVPRACEDGTADVLEALMSLYRHGELAGLALSYRIRGGIDCAVYTGVYRDRPAEALRAAMRVSWLLTQLEEESRGPP